MSVKQHSQSIVWEHFIKKACKIVECKLCQKNLKFFGNTSNIRQHLKRKHPDVDLGTDCNRSSHQSLSSEETPGTSVSIVSPEESEMQSIKSTSCGSRALSSKQIHSMDRALLKMIAKDFQPLSVVENKGFILYSKQLQPLYTLPSRKKLTKELLPLVYEETRGNLETSLSQIEYLSVTTDIWTSDANKAFLTVTAHFISNGARLNSCVLDTECLSERHTGENIAHTLMNIFEKWHITEKIVIIITDNASNMKSAVINYLGKYHYPCVAHTINLAINDAVSENETVSHLLEKCRVLVSHFKSSTASAETLRKIQKQMNCPELKLKQEVSTRWNSRLYMLQRLAEIKAPLAAAISSLPKAPKCISYEEFDLIQDSISLLLPFEEMTKELSGENYVTMSMIVPLVRGLHYSLSKQTPKTEAGMLFQTDLLAAVRERLLNQQNFNVVAKATFLDPRFKLTAFGTDNHNASNNAKKCILEEVASIFASRALQQEFEDKQETPQDSLTTAEIEAGSTVKSQTIWEQFEKDKLLLSTSSSPSINAETTVNRYLELPLLDRHSNPLEFWETNKFLLPELYVLSKKYLTVPATSVPAERLFSKAGQLTNEKRSRLLPKHVNYILFLNSNLSYDG